MATLQLRCSAVGSLQAPLASPSPTQPSRDPCPSCPNLTPKVVLVIATSAHIFEAHQERESVALLYLFLVEVSKNWGRW